MTRKARMRLIILLLTVTLGVLALAQANSQGASSLKIERSTTELVSPASAPAGTYFDHVVIILMENQGVFDICRSSPPPCSTSGPARYMASLANNYTIGSQYLSLINTSQPNYVALISGSLQGCTSSGCPVIKAPNLVDRFESAGISWRGYFENQTPTRGCDNAEHEPYTNIHNPFVAFQDITNNTARCNKLYLANPSSCGTVTDCVLVNDLNNATAPAPNFMWLTPNDCNNMRGASGICSSSISTGNTYLSKLVPSILNSRTFTTTRSALFITFDEGNGFCPLNGSSEDCVYASWSGPVAKTRFGTTNLYKHYSFTKTIEVNWNLASFTTNDANANPMTEFFKPQAADFTISANPTVITFPTGVTTNSTITLTSINNFTGTVTLTRSSSPPGPTLTLNPTSIILSNGGTGSSTLSITSTTTGSYAVTVTGTSGSLSHNATITATVTPPPDFAITSPSSLTLGQGATAGSPVAVNSTGDRTFFGSSYLADSFNGKGRTWLFYGDSRSTCEHQTGCLMYTSSTNGSRWAPASTIPVHVTDYDFSVYTDGNNVYYVRYNETSFEATCGRNLQFRIGALSTSGTITWQPEQTVAAGASNRSYPDDEIVVDSNGQVWIGYMIANKTECGGNGTDRPQVIHSAGTNYASWTGNTTLCVSVCHSDIWHIALASLGNGQVYASYWLPNRDLHGRLYNNGWQGEEQISTTTTTSDTNAWLFNSGTNVYAIYYDNSTESLNLSSRSSTGSWTINRIGTGESHTGTLAFSPSYYSLPNTASFDSTNNRFYVFWMNATNHAIDQWAGIGSNWTRTTGIVSTGTVTYPDGIISFIQSTPTVLGAIFYIGGGSSPFTINSVSLSFSLGGSTGMLPVTVTGQNGFTGTVNLSTTTTPSTGLAVNCTPTSILGGSGTSNCALNSSTPGNYTVTITGTSGLLNHQTTTVVSVQQPPPSPDFTIAASSPAPINAGQSASSTITVTALNGFSGTVSLTDTIPSGLSCGSISPGSITGSGTASLSCNASVAGNYTLTITGTSGSLVHTATVLFQFRDFTIAASSVTANAGASGTSTITVTAINTFAGTVTLTDNVPSGLVCGSITPASVTGSGTATVSCSAAISGNYTLAITGTSGSLVHTATPIFQVQDFGIAASSPAPVNAGSSVNSTITISSINHFAGVVSLTDTVLAGLTCGTISQSSITGSGTATVSCTATIAGNYTLTLTGTSGSLVHSAVALFQYRDFTMVASAPGPVNVGSSAITTVTVNSVNHFGGIVSLTDTVPSGLTCANITPSSVTGSGTATISCTATIAGNYTLAVTGTSGSLSHTATASFRIQDFNISASSPAPANVGASPKSTITVAALNGFAGIVDFTDTAPSGLSCGTITPTSVTGSGTASVSCSATAAGNYTLTVTGTNGSLIHSTTVVFQIRDFTINSTSLVSANAGVSSISTIDVSALNHFSGTVSLTDSVPSGLVCGAISPSSLAGSGTATLSCSTAVAGNFTLTLIGTAGPLVRSATTLFQFWDFNTSASSPPPVNAGASAISTITITETNHFNGVVSLTDTLSTGLVCGAITPTSITGSGTATVSCNATIAGNYTLTVTGTNGGLSHSATITITVQDYAIVARPSIVKINAGSTGSSIITITPLNHFSGTLSLSASGTAGLTLAVSPASLSGGSGNATLTLSSNTAGNYTATIASSSGTLTHSIVVSVQVVDFAVAASPNTITVLASATGNSTITVTAMNGFSATVNLILTPSTGLTATTVPTTIAGSGSSTMLVSASMSGDYSITIRATSGSLSHVIGVVIHVLDYSLAGIPVSPVAPIGSSTSSTLTVQSLNGYSGNLTVTYTVQADPNSPPGSSGAGGGRRGLIMAPTEILPIISISPQSFQLSSGGTQQSIVSISLPSNLPSGNYLITITASDGMLSHQILLTLVATDYGLTATPNSSTIQAGSNTTIIIGLQSLNFFQGNITLTVNSPPGGPTGTLTTYVTRLTFNSNVNLNLTIQVPADTALGNYTITVQATSGTISHILSIPVRVTSTGFVAILAEIFSSHNSTPITALAIITILTTFATLRVRTYARKGPGICSGRRIQNHYLGSFEAPRYVPSSSSLPVFWSLTGTDSSKV